MCMSLTKREIHNDLEKIDRNIHAYEHYEAVIEEMKEKYQALLNCQGPIEGEAAYVVRAIQDFQKYQR